MTKKGFHVSEAHVQRACMDLLRALTPAVSAPTKLRVQIVHGEDCWAGTSSSVADQALVHP